MIRKFNQMVKRQISFYNQDSYGHKAINNFFLKATQTMNLSEREIEIIKQPHSLLKVNVPVLRDDGTYSTIVAFRCHHTMHEMPLEGGLVVSPKINQQTVVDQALMTTIQHAYLKIPFGGARGGLKINSNNYSEQELEWIFKRLTIELAKYNFIGSKIDVISSEKGCKNEYMDFMKGIYDNLYGFKDINSSASVTGKSPVQGGNKNHSQTLGSAIYYSITTLLQHPQFEELR